MSKAFQTYQPDIYHQFKEIDKSAYREIIEFYEDHKYAFSLLDIEEQLEIQVAYSNSLFEIGQYQKFVHLVNELIELVIFHNIKYLNGEDIFLHLLFKKAAAHYQSLEYEEADNILWELIKMNPNHAPAVYLLKKCRVKQQPDYLRNIKAASIVMFLAGAGIIAIEILAIRPFFQTYTATVEAIRNIIFFGGLFILVFSDICHRIKSFHQVNQQVKDLKEIN